MDFVLYPVGTVGLKMGHTDETKDMACVGLHDTAPMRQRIGRIPKVYPKKVPRVIAERRRIMVGSPLCCCLMKE